MKGRLRVREPTAENTKTRKMRGEDRMNETPIVALCEQMQMVTARIQSIVKWLDDNRDSNSGLAETYEQFLMDEIMHVQIITLEMTKTVTEKEDSENGDEAFTAGELNSVIGENQEEYPED